MKLWDYQQQALDWGRNKNKVLYALEQRLGKTPITINRINEIGKGALIIVPAALRVGWLKEFALWAPDITATMVKTKGLPENPEAEVFICSYDQVEKFLLGRSTKIDHIVLDECHRLKNPKAKRTKVLTPVIQKAKYVTALSGTPIPNKPIEIWPLLWGMGKTRLNHHFFGLKYANGWKAPWGSWDYSGASNLDGLKELMSTFTLRMERKDVGGFREKMFKVVALDMPVDKREKEYDLKEVEGAANPLSFDGLSEILKDHGLRKVKPAVDYVKPFLDNGESVILFAHHKDVVAGLEEALQKYGVVKVVGGMTPGAVAESVEQFQKEKVKVFIGNIQAASEGLTLKRADRVIMVEGSWVPGQIAQATDRGIFRGGEPMPVDILTIHKSIDEYMLEKTLKKSNVISNIMPSGMIPEKQPKPNREVIMQELTKSNPELAAKIAEVFLAQNKILSEVLGLDVQGEYPVQQELPLETPKEEEIVVEQAPKPKPKRRTKAQLEADRKAKEEAVAKERAEEAAEVEPEVKEEPKEEAPAPTMDVLREAAKGAMGRNKDAVKAYFQELGVASLTAISEDKWTAAVERFNGIQ